MLRARRATGVDAATLARAVAASVEGYPFPTNLDLDANVGGLTPRSQAELATRALVEDAEPDALAETLDAYESRHRSDGV